MKAHELAPHDALEQNSRRVVPCLLGDEFFCFPSGEIRSIAPGTVCKFRPQPMDGIVGETSFAGREIPVFGLRNLLGLPPAEDATRQYVVVAMTSHGECGMLVDDVLRARDAMAAIPLPAVARDETKPYLSGIVQIQLDNDNVLVESKSESVPALLLSSDGLVGVSTPKLPTFLQQPSLDLAGLSLELARKNGQLMLFDLPHQAWKNRVISIALSVTQVLEVTGLCDLHRVPGAPPHMLGLAHWRNHFVPILDLTQQLDFEAMPDEARSRIVIARSQDNELIGFYASQSIRTVRMPFEASPIEMEGISGKVCVRGCYGTKGGVVIVPSIKALASPPIPNTAA